MTSEYTNKKTEDIAILILAAGSSSRMGQSKQSLLINGEPLLKKIVRIALDVKKDNVFVVLGSEEAGHKHLLGDTPVKIVINKKWQRGIGSSLKTGLQHILRTVPKTKAVVVLVCDQPHVTTKYIGKLIQHYASSDATIAASRYGGTWGVPALFSNIHFNELISLEDRQRPKEVIEKNSKFVAPVDFPEGEIDLDTIEDYHEFIKRNNTVNENSHNKLH